MRLKIDLPSRILFSTVMPVTLSDINYGNHMGNERFLLFAHEARLRWFRSLGYDDELALEGGIGIVMTQASIQFLAEVFHGEEITINLGISETTKYGFEVVYQMMNRSGKEVARVSTGIIGMDYQTRKVAAIPSGFFDKLNH